MTLRPYQFLCAICSLDDGGQGANDVKSREILEAVRKNPDMPIVLRCNVGGVFAYQDTGTSDDTPEGAEFNVRRDLEILYKANLIPGCALPARVILNRLLDTISKVSGICGYHSVTSDCWRGCPKANSGCYEKGRGLGIKGIIPPRSKSEMDKEKAESLIMMRRAEAIRVRPHILLCAVCQYGGGIRPPFPEDNLPELIELILKKPDTRLIMASHADWMMCAPCPNRAPGLNGCVSNKGSGGLPNQMRDLRVLQKLGLAYGSTLKARDLYKLIFERIPGTLAICRIEHSEPSVWWTNCGAAAADSESYAKGRKMLIVAMEL